MHTNLFIVFFIKIKWMNALQYNGDVPIIASQRIARFVDVSGSKLYCLATKLFLAAPLAIQSAKAVDRHSLVGSASGNKSKFNFNYPLCNDTEACVDSSLKESKHSRQISHVWVDDFRPLDRFSIILRKNVEKARISFALEKIWLFGGVCA